MASQLLEEESILLDELDERLWLELNDELLLLSLLLLLARLAAILV